MNELINLPEVEFASKDVGQIETDIITVYEALAERKLAPGDPIRIFLQSVASIIAQQRVLINDTGKQNLLAYSRGAVLDQKGADTGTERLGAQAAKTTIRFTLSAAQSQTVTIPSGTRVTPGGQLFFAVDESTDVAAGLTQIDIETTCTVSGIVGNDWQPGQINILVDPLPWIQKSENTTKSSGGTDTEGDDNYRERIHQAPESFSTAGPEGAYIYWAKAANQLIADIAVDSPAAGEIAIYVLLEGGEIPGNEILQAVLESCNNKKVRPLTDKVSALAPGQVNYDIDFTYWIGIENTTRAVAIQENVEKAVDEYKEWQQSKLGRDINPSELITRVMQAGTRRVTVTSPNYTQISRSQVAYAETVSVQYGGIEE